jgi:hypothetical protein
MIVRVGQEFGWPMNSCCVSNIKNMSELFMDNGGFHEISSTIVVYGLFGGADAFNGDLWNWNVSCVTSMSSMSYNADVFNGNLLLWDFSSITDMNSIFNGVTAFHGKLLSAGNASSIPDRSYMFSGQCHFLFH